jgi:hypothetical protein
MAVAPGLEQILKAQTRFVLEDLYFQRLAAPHPQGFHSNQEN